MANSSLTKELPECKYGSLCYRTNADHRMNFWHPEDLTNATSNAAKEHGANNGSKDGGTADMLDEEFGDAGEGELDAHKGLSEIELNEVAITHTESKPIIAERAKKADAGVLLLLIGVPGSGKSTFCGKLMSHAAQPWTRICQDIIAKGKRGTKSECLRHAERALGQNCSVVIDRCNIDRAQRLEFLQLAARLGVEAHAVVLNLPASVCIQRASKRVGHEGGVGVGNAGSVINRFTRTRQQPLLSEGFLRITFCRTDIDVEKAVQQYKELLPSRPLDWGVFGAAVSKGKNDLQLVLEKGSDEAQYEGSVIGNFDQQVEKGMSMSRQAQVVSRDREESDQMQEPDSSRKTEASNMPGNSHTGDQGSSTLAFPSISTSDFHFDHERASNVLVEVLSEFFVMTKGSNLRLVLVDLTDSHMLSLVRRKSLEKGFDSLRFLTFVGDITKLRSSGGPACNIIANAANWRLRAGGGGVNAAIYKAAGPGLEQATKKVAQTLSPGTSVVIQLPELSPLYKEEGVTHVVHVLGPNMNPQRPNCLSGDYSEGCRILRSAYASLFQNFSSIVQLTPVSEPTIKTSVDTGSLNPKPTKNAFTVLMQASKRSREVKDSNFKKDKVRVTGEVAGRAGRGSDTALPQNPDFAQSSGPEKLKLHNQPSSTVFGMSTGGNPRETDTEKQAGVAGTTGRHQGGDKNGKRWDGWALALYKAAMNPGQNKDTVLQVTDDAVVLRDVYPKAKKHLLVVARKPGLDGLEDIQKEHLPVLQHMHSLGREWAASFLKEDPSLTFRLGYHSVPSMRQVHLHVISQDFDSASLKNKKHWNSFTTLFFLDSLDVVDQVEKQGQVQICVKDAEELLDLELRCHRCRSAHPNLPRLKQHISSCRRPFANASYLITIESMII